MKAFSTVALLFGAAMIATVPVSGQVTSKGVELKLDQAQAQVTYGRARRVARRVDRRVDRRAFRYARRGGYVAGIYGPGYGYRSGYSATAGYGYGGGYQVVSAGPRRSCTIYPSGFRWCWTYF